MNTTIEKQILNSIGQDTHIEPTGLKGKELLRWAINRLIANDGSQHHQEHYHHPAGHCLWGWLDIGIHGSAALTPDGREYGVHGKVGQMYPLLNGDGLAQMAKDIGATDSQMSWTACCTRTKEQLYLFCREFLAGRPTVICMGIVTPEFAEVLDRGVTRFVPL